MRIFIFFLLILTFLSLTLHAKNNGDGLIVDHNYGFGAGLRLDIFRDQAKLYSQAGGIAANLEVLITETHYPYIVYPILFSLIPI